MSKLICPTCRRAFAPPKLTRLPERSEIDVRFTAKELSQADYFAQCKRIAPRDDLRFLIRVAGSSMPDVLLSEASSLLTQLEQRTATAADSVAINRLRDRYRISKGSLIVRAAVTEAAA